MAVFYFDTSVLVKRYRTELGSEVLANFFKDKAIEDTYFTSQITILELESAVARLHKAGLLDSQSHQEVVETLGFDTERYFILLPVASSLIPDAIQIARRHALRAVDSIHLAATIRLKEILSEEITLVTSDQELVQAGTEAGLTVIDPVRQG
jgi:predicted nucleic acid-binding protein